MTVAVSRVVFAVGWGLVAVRILDDRAIKFTMKKAGKPYFECIETVSPDGHRMTEDFTNTIEAETVTGKAGFTRVSNGPPGSHALSGQWRMDTVRNDTQAGTLTIIKSTPSGMKISDGSESYEACRSRIRPLGRSSPFVFTSTFGTQLLQWYMPSTNR